MNPIEMLLSGFSSGDPSPIAAAINQHPVLHVDPAAQGFLQGAGGASPVIRAYTGLPEGVSEPSANFGGARGGIPSDKGTVYFTPNQRLAEMYGDNVVQRSIDASNAGVYDANKLVDDPHFVDDMRAAHYDTSTRNDYLQQQAQTPEGAAKIETNFQDALRRIQARQNNDYGFPRYHPAITGAILNRARQAGQDVAIIKNMAEGHGQPSDQIVVLNNRAILPEQ